MRGPTPEVYLPGALFIQWNGRPLQNSVSKGVALTRILSYDGESLMASRVIQEVSHAQIGRDIRTSRGS